MTDRYNIIISSSAINELSNLPENILRRVERAIDLLELMPKPKGCIKIKSRENLYRIRIGSYRVIYEIDDLNRIVDICYIRHRNKAYRGLK